MSVPEPVKSRFPLVTTAAPSLLKTAEIVDCVVDELTVSVPKLFNVPDPKISELKLVFCRLKFAPELLFSVPSIVKSLVKKFQSIVPLFSQVTFVSRVAAAEAAIVVVTALFVVSVLVPLIVPPLQAAALVTVISSSPCNVPAVTVRLATLKALPVVRVVVPLLIVMSPMLVIFAPVIVLTPPEPITVRSPSEVIPVALRVFVPVPNSVVPVTL